MSLSTLPGRISYLKDQLRFLYRKRENRMPTRPSVSCGHCPSRVAAAAREGPRYTIPESPTRYRMRGRRGPHRLLRTQVDWGPATKLIPTLSVETDPRTIIITVDDDLDYPSTLIEHLYRRSLQRPDAAIGMKGYWLPPTNTTLKDKCDLRTWDHVSKRGTTATTPMRICSIPTPRRRTETSRSTC